jgi:RND family efflux transporter MFP subunit
VIGQEELDLIQGDRDEAKASLDNTIEDHNLAKLRLEWTNVTARISGMVSRRMVDPGALVKADDTVMTNIVTQDPLYVYFDLDESTLLRLRTLIRDGTIQSHDGKAVSVAIGMADEDDYPSRGTVDFSENRTDPNTGTLRLRGTIENPLPYMLNPGMFVNVRLPVGEPHDVLLIPEQSIGTDQGRKFVYVVNDKDEIVYRPVKLGFAESSLRTVEEGLAPNERIVLSGIQRLRPGLKVAPELPEQAAAKGTKTAGEAGQAAGRPQGS